MLVASANAPTRKQGLYIMKRFNNLYDQIYTRENIFLAYLNAKKKKGKKYGVRKFKKNLDNNLESLYNDLKNNTYAIPAYRISTIYEPKERLIYSLPFSDRIVQHAILNVIGPIWDKVFIQYTYSGIRKRGIHGFAKGLSKPLKDVPGTKYCLKIDATKFYPSIDHDIMKIIIRKKIKDQKLLSLLDKYIDSAPGMPIGNYLSQYMANLYLSYFDHWAKEDLKVQYYFRYCDDVVILAKDKPTLHLYRLKMDQFMRNNLKLEMKGNYQVFPVDARGIDVVGYIFFHTHTLLRKSIKKNFCRAASKANKKKLDVKEYKRRLSSWLGWLKFCDSKNLIKKIIIYENICAIKH